jgi:aquaporin Z
MEASDSAATRSEQATKAGPAAHRARRAAAMLFLSEFVGTGLLLAVGLSAVIMDFAPCSPVYSWLGAEGVRRAVTGFLFGSTGALIAVSPVGKVSGAHINPAVTLMFFAQGRLRLWHAAVYGAAQCAGAAVGALLLLTWGHRGASVQYGATTPGAAYGAGWALLGEVATTFTMILCLEIFLGHRRLRAYTPLLFPFLYAIMVYLEAPVSGTSTNPARSLGPALIAGVWRGWWVYWLGPVLGALLAVVVHRGTPLHHLRVEVAKLYHFQRDPHGIFYPGKLRAEDGDSDRRPPPE